MRKKYKYANVKDLSSLKTNLSNLSETIKLLQTETITDDRVIPCFKEKFKDSLFRFYSVIDTIDDIIIIQDSEGRWRTLNKFGQRLFGLLPFQFIGKTCDELIAEHPYLDDVLTKCKKLTKKAWDLGHSVRSTEEFVINGKEYYVDFIKTPNYYINGDPKDLITIGRDMTDIISTHQRNKEFVSALNSASDIILIADANGNITFCNNSFLHTFKFPSLIEVQGKSLSIINSGKMSTQFFKELWCTIKSNRTWSDLIINKCTDGTLINCIVNILPVMDEGEFPAYYICTMKIPKLDE